MAEKRGQSCLGNSQKLFRSESPGEELQEREDLEEGEGVKVLLLLLGCQFHLLRPPFKRNVLKFHYRPGSYDKKGSVKKGAHFLHLKEAAHSQSAISGCSAIFFLGVNDRILMDIIQRQDG